MAATRLSTILYPRHKAKACCCPWGKPFLSCRCPLFQPGIPSPKIHLDSSFQLLRMLCPMDSTLNVQPWYFLLNEVMAKCFQTLLPAVSSIFQPILTPMPRERVDVSYTLPANTHSHFLFPLQFTFLRVTSMAFHHLAKLFLQTYCLTIALGSINSTGI